LNPDLTEDIQKAVLKALAKKREDRYRSVSEMMAVFLKAFDTLIKEHPSDGEAPTVMIRRETAAEVRTTADVSIGAEEASTEAVAQPQKSRIPGWIWWMAVPAFVLFCLGSAVLSNAMEPPGPDLITGPTLTYEASHHSAPVLGEIKSLNQQIQENPDDPFLVYQLGVAYLEADRPQPARDAFQRAYKLAEENPEIILELGERLTEINIWTYAAYSFLKVDQLGYPIPPDKINEAVYRAAFEDLSFEILSRNPELNLDPSLSHLLEARKALLAGRVEVAERLVDRVMEERPDLLEAYLIKSDILFAQERFEEARDVLLELEQKEDLPLWIQEELGISPQE
jgi:tetratricopeptide (TPR) repeat protein